LELPIFKAIKIKFEFLKNEFQRLWLLLTPKGKKKLNFSNPWRAARNGGDS
jgi:hypothetical protein